MIDARDPTTGQKLEPPSPPPKGLGCWEPVEKVIIDMDRLFQSRLLHPLVNGLTLEGKQVPGVTEVLRMSDK